MYSHQETLHLHPDPLTSMGLSFSFYFAIGELLDLYQIFQNTFAEHFYNFSVVPFLFGIDKKINWI